LTVFSRTDRPSPGLRHRSLSQSVLGLVLAVGFGAVPPASGAEPLPLTLEDAIARALEQNEGILIERAGRDAAAAAIEGAGGAYDPYLGVSAAYRRSVQPVNSAFSGAPEGEPAPTNEELDGSASVSQLLKSGGEVTLHTTSSRAETNGAFGLLSPFYASELGVELRQPLLRDRSVDAARLTMRVAAADRDRAVASLEREVSETVAAVERAYWNLLSAHRMVEVGEETVALAKEQLEQTGHRIESGVAPETEISQPQAELERRRGDLLASREVLARAENALKFLILGDDEGALWSRSIQLLTEVDIKPRDVDTAAEMERALAERSELAVAEAAVERRRAESKFATDRLRPSLDLVISYDRYGLTGSKNAAASAIPGLEAEVPPEFTGGWGSSFGALGDGDFDDRRIALELGLPIGNQAARANAEIARQTELVAAAELSRFRKQIRAEVLDAAAGVETTRGRIEAARAARQAAEVQLSSERERYDVGLSTNFLVLTRQNDLAGARLTEIEAQTDYLTARAELARATGSLLRDRGIEVDER
jgi:outer membrane protein TolC